MAINNLEQKRLLYAKRKADAQETKSEYASMIKKVPAYILKNGFPYTMAFLNEKGKSVFNDIVEWHCSNELNEQRLADGKQDDFLNYLLGENMEMDNLRALTMETLAIMKCFRRFVKD